MLNWSFTRGTEPATSLENGVSTIAGSPGQPADSTFTEPLQPPKPKIALHCVL